MRAGKPTTLLKLETLFLEIRKLNSPNYNQRTMTCVLYGWGGGGAHHCLGAVGAF